MNCFNESGRLTIQPFKIFREIHGKDEINIIIYRAENSFFYTINCKLGAFIRSYYPHPDTPPLSSLFEARAYACNELKQWLLTDRAAKRRAKTFSILEFRQQEFEF